MFWWCGLYFRGGLVAWVDLIASVSLSDIVGFDFQTF